MYKGPERYGER